MPAARAVPATAPVRRARRRAVGVLAVVVGLAILATGGAGAVEDGAGDGPVHVVGIRGEIDLGLAPFLDRALREAAEADASAVLLDIDTPGGRLDAVLQMRDALLASPVPTVAFVDRTALSAGALIALSADEIHVAPGAVIGAATPVDGTGIPADEKVVSAVRSVFRATADQRGRDPVVAEAMVDPAVAIDGLIGRGQLLTLTGPEALDLGYAEGSADDLSSLLQELGLGDRAVVEARTSPAEHLTRIVTSQLVASLLLAAGVLLLIGDLLSGGVGIAAAIGATLLATFLGGHLIAGLAGWEDVALVVIGVGLLLLEVFVLPGIGIAGVLGLVTILGGGFLASLSRDFDFVGADQLLRAGLTVGLSFVLIVGGLLALLTYLSRRGGPRRLVLGATLGDGTPVTERSNRGWLAWFDADAILASDRDEVAAGAVGRPPQGAGPTAESDATARRVAHLGRADTQPGASGVALTDLRPAGVAEIAGRRVDVVTEGEYLRAGEAVEVLVDEGYRRVVRRLPD